MKAGPFLILAALLPLAPVRPDVPNDPALPPGGFDGDRYAPLWKKSPFALATPDAPATSAEYQLVGLAQFDGVAYASLVNKQSQEHFIVGSDKPSHDITLVSVAHDAQGGGSAVIEHNGERLSLQQDAAPAAGAPGMPVAAAPPVMQYNPTMTGNVGGMIPVKLRARFHRPNIIVPPPPPPGSGG